MLERGILFDSQDGEEDEYVANVLDYHQWEEFTKPPGKFSLDLVWEFYKNQSRNSNFSTFKGRRINYSPRAINRSYNLQTPADDTKTLAFIDKPDLNKIERIFCPFGANWGYEGDGNKISLFEKNIMYKARPFLHFLSSRMIPNSHTSEIYSNRFALLYIIYLGMSVNVGKFMNSHIKMCRFDQNVGTLWFPSTIIRLIMDAGVIINSRAMSPSNKILDKKLWSRLAKTHGPRRKEGEEELLLRNRRRQQTTFPTSPTPPTSPTFKIVMELLHKKYDDIESSSTKKKEEVTAQLMGVEDKLMNKLDRIENIFMQGVIYNCDMIWGLANFTQRMDAQWNYNESTFFPLFNFVDPSTSPIQRWYSLKELTQMELMKEQPQPPPDVDNSWFSLFKFDDFDHYDDMVSNWLDLNNVVTISYPLTTPTLGGITIREPNSKMRRAKRPKEDEGKGNNTMEEEEDSSNYDNEASIRMFEVGQSSMMHPKEQGDNFLDNTQDGEGSSGEANFI
ncbi:hypothetical protein FXO37_20522 [Capsicum annuum]|nr:hypothetical protein FXO37_20522 [Capsicum annuum]